MPLFSTPKPRQFHYKPRFYNPEHEKWEALKQKYADEKAKENETSLSSNEDNKDLEYFQAKVRKINRDEQRTSPKLGFQDLYKKRKMPTFNYQPRFSNTEDDANNEENTQQRVNLRRPSSIKIRRRFDIEDPDYMKPVSGGKIALYTLLTLMLLYWILF